MVLTRDQLQEHLQRYRLASDSDSKNAAYSELLKATGKDICGILLLCAQEQALGVQSLKDVLNTIHGIGGDEVCLDLVTSPSLRQLLEACNNLNNTNANKLLLEIIYDIHMQKKENICADLREDVTKFCGRQIASESIGLSDVACKLTISIARSCEDKKETHELLNQFHRASSAFIESNINSSNSVIRTRYCSMMASILGTKNRDDLFEAALHVGAVKQILDLCEDKSDPLLQINAFELLAEFGGTEAGFRYIQETGIPMKLLKMARPGSEESDPLLGPEALTSLSAIFHRALSRSPRMSVEHNEDRMVNIFLETMLANIHSDSEKAKISGLNAIVEFASSSYEACKRVTEKDEAIGTLVGLLNSPKQDMKVAALYGLAKLVACDFCVPDASISCEKSSTVFESATSISDIEALSACLFDKVGRMSPSGQDTLGLLLDILKRPFSEIRIPVMMVIKAAASFDYGMSLFFHSTKAKMFRDFLERHSELDKRGKEAKHGIIVAIANNSKFGLLSEENQRFITTMKSRGPFYVPSAMAEPQVI